jgi:serine/threonine-protein kinase
MPDLIALLQQALAGRYVIEREVGRGGMAMVFLAQDLRHPRQVAVKVLRPEVAAAMGGERFLREIAIATSMVHPHILPIHDSGEYQGLLFYVMPYVEGESLRDRMLRDGRFPLDDAIRITRDLAGALAYAHQRGVVHRDVKPENIMLLGEHALIADFGIARALGGDAAESRLTETGLAVGTPSYMSPEQAAGDRNIEGRSDQYSLACVLYEMLAGEPPLAAGSAQAMLARRLTEPAPSLKRLRGEIPDRVERAVAIALDRDPARRFNSIAEFSTALAADAIPAGAGPSVSWWRRHRVLLLAAMLTILAAAYLFQGRRSPGTGRFTGGDVRSIAVLPLLNVGGDTADQYFAAGMTEELGSALTKVPGLSVLSRTSAYSAKASSGDARDIGRALNVTALLEGSVLRNGSRLRVTVTLTNVRDGLRMWSEQYDREVKDVFAVQDDIARAVAGALQVRLGAGPGSDIARRSTGSPEAHDLYLQGRYFYEKRTEAGLRKAVDYFQQAIRKDSVYALAYAGLGDSYGFLATFGYARPREMFPLATAAALKAIQLDSSLAEAHASLAFIHLFYDWDWSGAGREFSRAIALDSTYVPARLFHAWYYVSQSRLDDAVREINRARALDPLSLIINTRVASMLSYARRDSEAVVQLHHTLELDSAYPLAHAQLAASFLRLSGCRDALAELPYALSLKGRYEGITVGYIYAVCGQREKALALLRDFQTRSSREYITPEAPALIYLGLGDRDSTLDWLGRAVDDRTWSMFLLNADRRFDPLRDDPRFVRLVERVGLPPGTAHPQVTSRPAP